MWNASAIPIIPVVRQHAEESANLRNMRSVLVTAPHVKLHHLRRLDDRVAAHLDGLAVAGEFGWKLCEAALENPGVGEVFAATEWKSILSGYVRATRIITFRYVSSH